MGSHNWEPPVFFYLGSWDLSLGFFPSLYWVFLSMGSSLQVWHFVYFQQCDIYMEHDGVILDHFGGLSLSELSFTGGEEIMAIC